MGKNENEPAFYYHSDHLGSASYVTNGDGKITQTLNYLPYGEDWVDLQYFDLMPAENNLGVYKFNGKEKDQESGYNYYGARYYDSEKISWLSVDPMSDKYPNLSPYVYCADNPVILVDPDGEEIFINGECPKEALDQLQKAANVKLKRDVNTGQLSVVGKIFLFNLKGRKLRKAINDKSIRVNVTTFNVPDDKKSDINSDLMYGKFNGNSVGGGFMGSYWDEKSKQQATSQYVYPERLEQCDKAIDNYVGGYMIHEVMESYYGGQDALRTKSTVSPGFDNNNYYNNAHKEANNNGFWGDYVNQPCGDEGYHIRERREIDINSICKINGEYRYNYKNEEDKK
jgi:RHS repeat-associated protein